MKAIKEIGVLTILSLLSLKVLFLPVLLVDYQVRKEYIIKNYCVNKDNIELNCDGKCFLAKRIKQAQKQDQDQGDIKFITQLYSFEYTSDTSIASFLKPKWLELYNLTNPFGQTKLLKSSFNNSFFVPPKYII